MYERNFSPLGPILFLTAVIGVLALVRSDAVDVLWARAVGIGDRAVHEVRNRVGHETIHVRVRGERGVCCTPEQEGAVRQRIAELRNGDASERRYAAWALGELESTLGVDPLIAALGDRDVDVRLASAWALGEIKDLDAIEPLVELLDDSDPLVREMAVLSLGEIERSTAIDPILAAVARHPELTEPAIWALGEIGGGGANEARDQLFKGLGQRGWENDEVWAGRFGTGEARSLAGDVPALIDALDDADAGMRASAAEWLGRADDEGAVEPLLDALRDRSPIVRAMAIWALDETNPSRDHEHEHDDHDHEHEHGNHGH